MFVPSIICSGHPLVQDYVILHVMGYTPPSAEQGVLMNAASTQLLLQQIPYSAANYKDTCVPSYCLCFLFCLCCAWQCLVSQ